MLSKLLIGTTYISFPKNKTAPISHSIDEIGADFYLWDDYGIFTVDAPDNFGA